MFHDFLLGLAPSLVGLRLLQFDAIDAAVLDVLLAECLAFKYSSPAFRGTEVRLDGDSITRIYFNKNTDAYQTVDVDAAEPGSYLLQLTATSTTGLPNISSLRVFPLEGLPVPTAAELTGIMTIKEMSDCTRYYNLNGVPSAVPHRGINIVRETINGKTKSYKIVRP